MIKENDTFFGKGKTYFGRGMLISEELKINSEKYIEKLYICIIFERIIQFEIILKIK